jgi:hypothetical protein
MVGELGLLLPSEFVVYVYPTRAGYARGLVEVGHFPRARAVEIATYSAGLGQAGRLFVTDAAFARVPRSRWLGILAHELTHVAQYELSGGRRGRSEQWLREGLADWVACRVLERLGEASVAQEHADALLAVARHLPALGEASVDLVRLGRPLDWEAEHLRAGDALTYRLALLLTAELIQQHGFERLLDYFRAFRDSDDRFGNFERTFGMTVAEFEAQGLGRIRAQLGLTSNPKASAPAPPERATR